MKFRSTREIDRLKLRVNATLPFVAWAVCFVSGVMTTVFTLMLLRDDIPRWLGLAALALGALANVGAIQAMIFWYTSREKLRSGLDE